jgi:hypothetical protein
MAFRVLGMVFATRTLPLHCARGRSIGQAFGFATLILLGNVTTNQLVWPLWRRKSGISGRYLQVILN